MNLSTLYTETELADYICPVALELAADKVAEVRQNAFHLVCVFIFPNISFYTRYIELSVSFFFSLFLLFLWINLQGVLVNLFSQIGHGVCLLAKVKAEI